MTVEKFNIGPDWKCGKCHSNERPHNARGLCRICYFEEKVNNTLSNWPTIRRQPKNGHSTVGPSNNVFVNSFKKETVMVNTEPIMIGQPMALEAETTAINVLYSVLNPLSEPERQLVLYYVLAKLKAPYQVIMENVARDQAIGDN